MNDQDDFNRFLVHYIGRYGVITWPVSDFKTHDKIDAAANQLGLLVKQVDVGVYQLSSLVFPQKEKENT